MAVYGLAAKAAEYAERRAEERRAVERRELVELLLRKLDLDVQDADLHYDDDLWIAQIDGVTFWINRLEAPPLRCRVGTDVSPINDLEDVHYFLRGLREGEVAA